MAAGGQMAEFFATLGFRISKGDIQKVDKQLDILEARAKRLSETSLSNIKVNISRFGFSDNFNTRLHKALKARMKVVTNKGIGAEIRVSKFDVDRNELLREMREAVRYVENNLRVNIRSNINRPSLTGSAAAGGAQGGAGGISRFGAGMGVGAASGNLGRGFIPGLGVAFGVSQLNKLNQQLIGQDLAATAVFGDEDTGQEQLGWLRNLGNKIGFDYRSQANPYLKMQASAQTAGMDMEVGQHIFQSMAEYGRVMGLGDEDMKGTMRAVEQMLNKGQVYAEELKMQLAEKFPAAIQLMAEAVAEGDTEKLFKMMEAGEIVSLEALPKFADILARQARVGGALEEAMKTSLSEQMRFNNTFNDLVMEFSEAGFEKGQAGIFRTMAAFFSDMLPLLRGFGEAWRYIEGVLRVPLGLLVDLSTGLEKLSEYTGMTKGSLVGLGTVLGLLAFPLTRTLTVITGLLFILEDFTAFLTGRGSVIGDFVDKLRENNPKEFRDTVREIKTAFEEVSEVIGVIIQGWRELIGLVTSQDFTSGALSVLRQTAREIGATAEALMRVMKAFGYKDPEETEADRLRKIQERSERPMSTMEIASERIKGMIRNPLSMFGIGNESVEEYGARLNELSKPETANRNPLFMNDEAVRQSHFTESQTMRIGGRSQQTFAESIIGNLTIQGYNVQSDEELARLIKKEFDDIMKPASDKASGASQ